MSVLFDSNLFRNLSYSYFYSMKLRFVLIFFFALVTLPMFASHLVGGYVRYECLGPVAGNQVSYRITLVNTRDTVRGSAGAPLENELQLTLFDRFNLATTFRIPRVRLDIIGTGLNDPCFVNVDSLIVERGVYQGNITLPNDEDFTLTYQRCCRNTSIVNLNLSTATGTLTGQGSTFTIDIPAFNSVGCNSSPIINQQPTVAYCPNSPLAIDLSATDPDGDSLVYSFCAPLNSTQISPPVAATPPYSEVSYVSPFTPQNPMPASPALSINPQTGLITGTPTVLGQYVIGICIEEYRNGNLLTTTRRDFQLNDADCSPVIVSAAQSQTSFCDGLSIQFNNQSTGNVSLNNFKWDFGDPTTLADTSRDRNPTYVYPDTGLYTIALIVNPGFRCADTSTVVFRVDSTLNPIIDVEGSACLNNNSLNFIARGQYTSNATFKWDFGPNSNLTTSTLDSVGDVQFSNGNNFPIQLVVTQDLCTDTVNRTIQLFERPIAAFTYDDSAGCYPFPVQFNNQSIFSGNADFIWSFGDGNSSSQFAPQHTYLANGMYDVRLELRTTSNCIDTSILIIPNAIDISLDSSTNDIQFSLSDSIVCQGSEVSFIDQSTYEGGADYFWDFGNNILSTDKNASFVYNDTGTYDIGLLLITKDKCIDTLQLSMNDALKVLQNPISNFVLDTNAKPVKDAEFILDASTSEFYNTSEFYLNKMFIHSGDFYTYSFQDTGTYTFTHIATKDICADTTHLEAKVYDEFEFIVPNVFTPNGDRINDEFKVRACGVYEYEIEIFNRYGTKLFQSNSMNINWDGFVDGRKAPDGVYFYNILIKDFRGEYLDYTGSLTLLSH